MPRYRDIIPDWDQFVVTCRRPAASVIRVNTLRADAVDVEQRLRRASVDVQPFPWNPELMRVDSPPGRRIEHWLGLYYIQEATQTVPVKVLAPQPGDRVLDLCAAPGGKSVQIAARMNNRGLLVANEPSGRRQPALLSNLNRMGVLNALVTDYRGESFPMTERFDRVLVDAPCSGEGTLRKDASVWPGARPATIKRLSRIQEHLIVRAFDVLRPGGTLVYSTCTFAPEENEAVVAHLLRSREAALMAVQLPFDASPGLATWGDTSYGEALTGCARIYPHQLDSGGGFLAHVQRPD